MNGKPAVVLLLLILALPGAAFAANVDLATVPARQSVQLTIYNSEDITLVRERRRLSFKTGSNPLQFSWANTLIDPTSVELRFPGHEDVLDVLDTTYPHSRPQLLLWNVRAENDVEAEIEISYFTSGITWSADYTAIADATEQTLRLASFVRVTNQSGEDYADAQVRLVVGKINLVERIAELARVPVGQLNLRLDDGERQELRGRALRQALEAMPMADTVAAPKEIEKEGLSDYFIYTIEGTETIPAGWSKRLRSFVADSVPLRVQYRYRLREYGDQLVRMYLLNNDTAAGLGTTPLPDGEMRVFRNNRNGGLSFLAAQRIRYVPIGDEIELNLGPDPEIVFELVKRRVFRDNLWLRLRAGGVYRRADQPGIAIADDSELAGWDEHTLFEQRIGNYSGRPIEVQIRRQFDGDVTFRSPFDARLHDVRTVEFATRLDPATRTELRYRVSRREGYNREQSRVQLEQE